MISQTSDRCENLRYNKHLFLWWSFYCLPGGGIPLGGNPLGGIPEGGIPEGGCIPEGGGIPEGGMGGIPGGGGPPCIIPLGGGWFIGNRWFIKLTGGARGPSGCVCGSCCCWVIWYFASLHFNSSYNVRQK